MGFPGGSIGKESTCSTRDLGLIPGLIKNLDIAEEIIDDKLFSEYIRIKDNQFCYWDNMFIMKKNDFLSYCEWIFGVLLKKTTILEGEEDWLAERLTSFWIWKNFRQERILRSERTQIN